MHRKRILWLVSWYPNRKDKFDGDFVQRHAHAAAIFNDIHVIFLTDLPYLADNEILNDSNQISGLQEDVFYYKKPVGLFAKIKKQWRWFSIYKKIIKNNIQHYGIPDIVHIHIPWKTGLIALWLQKKYNLQYIISEHWGIYNKVVDDNFHKRSYAFKRLLKRIYEHSKYITTVSKFMGDAINKIVAQKNYFIIPNVVDTTLFFFKVNIKNELFTFLHVSNMVPLKNVDGILEAFYALSQTGTFSARLILIGNRDNTYTKKAEQLGLLNRSVFFLGEVAYKDVATHMQESHCLILNSLIENSPCVITEALCCGLPVITTNVGGISELVDESNSMFVPVNDSVSLSIAMCRMKAEYDRFNHSLIAKKASQKFSYSAISEQFRDIYQTVPI